MLDICKMPWSILKGLFVWAETAALMENDVDGTMMKLKIPTFVLCFL